MSMLDILSRDADENEITTRIAAHPDARALRLRLHQVREDVGDCQGRVAPGCVRRSGIGPLLIVPNGSMHVWATR